MVEEESKFQNIRLCMGSLLVSMRHDFVAHVWNNTGAWHDHLLIERAFSHHSTCLIQGEFSFFLFLFALYRG